MTNPLAQQPQPSSSSQSGFTIIESLVAIVVVAILLTAIAPVIVLSVATRVQARRVELGTQAARSYVDGLKTGSITSPEVSASGVRDNFVNVAAPTPSALTCTNNNYCTAPASASLYCIDGNSDGVCTNARPNDLIIQAIRYSSTSTDATQGYLLGLRVYRADAFQDSGAILKSSDGVRRAQQTFRGTLGQRKAPILEFTTEIAASATYDTYCQRLGGC